MTRNDYCTNSWLTSYVRKDGRIVDSRYFGLSAAYFSRLRGGEVSNGTREAQSISKAELHTVQNPVRA